MLCCKPQMPCTAASLQTVTQMRIRHHCLHCKEHVHSKPYLSLLLFTYTDHASRVWARHNPSQHSHFQCIANDLYSASVEPWLSKSVWNPCCFWDFRFGHSASILVLHEACRLSLNLLTAPSCRATQHHAVTPSITVVYSSRTLLLLYQVCLRWILCH